jgi:two-component system, NtrC family, sensor histidine kinase GlrK
MSNTIPLRKKLSDWYPKSFSGLILAGFLLASLPLMLSLMYSAASINQLAKQNRQVVYKAERIAHFSRLLIDDATTMEHSVKLSSILSDESLLKNYYQSREKFRETLESLSALPLTPQQGQLLQTIDATESAIYQNIALIVKSHQSEWHIDFSALLDSTQSFLNHGDAPIEREVGAMQEMADQANRIIIWLLIALVPFVILLAFGFSILIARPIRQIDEVIRAMGNGNLSNSVRIVGPQDLQQLGDRLDWMRLRLLEIEEQKSTFLQHVSHELKTPLTSIREGANLLSEGIAGALTANQEEIVRILATNSIQLQKRIEDLLNFSALQSEKVVLLKQKIALRPLLELVVHDQSLAIANKKLRIELSCPDIAMTCDEQKFRTIVDNLLSNAIKYSPPGGLIRIRAERTDRDLKLDVIDFGPGIDNLDKEKIFEAFYQGRRAPQSHIRGTGLGLSIAREYTLAHGGTIELTEQNEGTCFRITLPIDTTAAAQ